jgi:predicted ester cyclase
MTNPTANHLLLNRLVQEALNSGELDVLDEILDPDVVTVQGGGVESVRQNFTMLRRVFPDLTMVEQEIIEDRDRIVGHMRVTGTQREEILGVAPTGKTFELDEILILHLRAGRIVEIRNSIDRLALLEQLGVFPVG